MFQTHIKETLNFLRDTNYDLKDIYDGISNIMTNLNRQHEVNQTLDQDKYNEFMENIDSIFSNYNEIDQPLSLRIFRKYSKFDLKMKILIIYNKLVELCKKVDVYSMFKYNYYII